MAEVSIKIIAPKKPGKDQHLVVASYRPITLLCVDPPLAPSSLPQVLLPCYWGWRADIRESDAVQKS